MLLKVPLVFNIPQEVTLDDSQMMFGHVFLYILPSCDSPGLFFPTTLCVALLLNCVSPAMLSIVPRHRAKLRFPGDVWLRFPTTSRWSAIPRPLCPADLQTCNFGRCLALFSPTTFCRASCFIAISWFYPWNAMLFEVTLRFYPLQEFSCDGGVLLVDSPLPGSWWQCFMTSLACFPISVHDIFKPPIIKTNDHC